MFVLKLGVWLTLWMGGWVLTLQRWMVHFEKQTKWETYFLPSFISERGYIVKPMMPLESFPITSKTDNGMTRYRQLFSIKKLNNYFSLSRGSHAASTKLVEQWGCWMSCQKPYRIRLPNGSSSPWPSVINLIRYSFTKKKILRFPWKNVSASKSGTPSDRLRLAGEVRGKFMCFYLTWGRGRRESPLYTVLLGHAKEETLQWEAGPREEMLVRVFAFRDLQRLGIVLAGQSPHGCTLVSHGSSL